MNAPSAGQTIADAVGRAILGADGQGLDPAHPQDHLVIVERAVLAEQAGRDLLQQAVAAARASGHSWAAIGGVLGMSRQAAQQRFGAVTEPEAEPEVRWLGPVTAFDELAELELAGRLGWRTVDAGMLKHKMMRTGTQWEHRRVVWRPTAALEGEGWQVAVRAFPWIYLVRDLGVPPESG